MGAQNLQVSQAAQQLEASQSLCFYLCSVCVRVLDVPAHKI